MRELLLRDAPSGIRSIQLRLIGPAASWVALRTAETLQGGSTLPPVEGIPAAVPRLDG